MEADTLKSFKMMYILTLLLLWTKIICHLYRAIMVFCFEKFYKKKLIGKIGISDENLAKSKMKKYMCMLI